MTLQSKGRRVDNINFVIFVSGVMAAADPLRDERSICRGQHWRPRQERQVLLL